MTLTLVIPGLLWPRQVMRDSLFDANFPALQTLLGKGRISSPGHKSADEWWSAQFGIGNSLFAPAPLRLLALGGKPDDSAWLCADPVHLEVNQRGAALKDPGLLAIDADEGRQLHATLAALFADVGELVATTPAHWHLRLKQNPPAMPGRLTDLVEQPATALIPSGDAGRLWRQLINDCQIALHSHAVNETRKSQRKTEINSIALWGAGVLPTTVAGIDSMMQCDEAVIGGLAKSAGLHAHTVAERFAATNNDLLVHWDKLQIPSVSHDALAWREALEHLEQDWIAPALAAVASGRLKKIELHGFGEDESVSCTMRSLDRYCFWRNPRRLETL